jgi:hypothetical protein
LSAEASADKREVPRISGEITTPGKTDISGRRSPDRQPLMGTREAEGIYFTSARRIARRPMASGIQSHTIVVTASCCQYSVVIELSKSRVLA